MNKPNHPLYCLITTSNVYAIKEGDLIACIPVIADIPQSSPEEKYFVHKVQYEDECFCQISRLGNAQSYAYRNADRKGLLDGSWYFIS